MQEQVLSLWAPGSHRSCKRHNCEKGPEVKFWLTETASWPQLKSWQGRLLAFGWKRTHVWKHTRNKNRQKCKYECRDENKSTQSKAAPSFLEGTSVILFEFSSLCCVSATEFYEADTPNNPQRNENPTGKWSNLTYRKHDVTTDAKHALWTSQRAVCQRDTRQKVSLQLSSVWGINATQFSCCNASNGFSGSDYSGNMSTFHSVADLDRKDVMSNHLVLT